MLAVRRTASRHGLGLFLLPLDRRGVLRGLTATAIAVGTAGATGSLLPSRRAAAPPLLRRADVHDTAAHHHSPNRAGYQEIDPFWEFVSGPLIAGAFGPHTLEGTFGHDGRVLPTRIPHGRTARRLEWAHLPPYVRSMVEGRLGSPVVEAESQGGGFTPGFASVLTCEDGSLHFVKAASATAQRMFAESYREEARKLRLLPAELPAPRLLWTEDNGEWVVLETEYVDGRAPSRPWTAEDLAVASAMAVEVAALLTPAPAGVERATEAFAAWPALWEQINHPHAAELGELAGRFPEVLEGETLAHTDIRDDNILVRPDGTAVMCDWNWPVVGPVWFDSLMLLIGPRGDGLDVEAHIAGHLLLSQVPPEHVDVALALVLAYFWSSSLQQVPPTSPYVRAAQAWQRDVIDDWIAERRSWR